MTALVLFDIDNTLLYTGGAGSAAMRLAFADVFGIPDGFAKVEFQGRTDRLILRDALRIHGLPDAALDARFDDFRAAYLVHLARLLEEYEGHLKPGLPDLLECLSRAGLRLGLATGNVREGAFRKLRHYGLDGYFERGGFGDSADDRASLVRDALAEFGCTPNDAPVLVIGDTPADVESATLNGVFGVGVATGQYGVDDLAAVGADLVLEDLGDVDRVLNQLLALASRQA